MTQRKLAALARDALFERERAARSEAESANRLKDEFLSTLSQRSVPWAPTAREPHGARATVWRSAACAVLRRRTA